MKATQFPAIPKLTKKVEFLIQTTSRPDKDKPKSRKKHK